MPLAAIRKPEQQNTVKSTCLDFGLVVYITLQTCCDCCALGIRAHTEDAPCDGLGLGVECDYAFRECCLRAGEVNESKSLQPYIHKTEVNSGPLLAQF